MAPVTDLAWQDHAACRGLPWWWDDGHRAEQIRTCAACPVVVDCLIYSFARNIEAEKRERAAVHADAVTDAASARARADANPTDRALDRAATTLERRATRLEQHLDDPLTGDNRADHGTWGGTGPRARRQGSAAWREGGPTWDAALAEHLAWLAAEGASTGRLTAHPWNRTGREQITHGLPGSYNHCTAGPEGKRCDLCKLGKGLHTDERRWRREGEAAA